MDGHIDSPGILQDIILYPTPPLPCTLYPLPCIHVKQEVRRQGRGTADQKFYVACSFIVSNCQSKCLCMWFPLLAKGSNKIELTYISLRDVIKQVLFY